MAELRDMLSLPEADGQEIFLSVVTPLLSEKLVEMMKDGDLTPQVSDLCASFLPSSCVKGFALQGFI